MESNTKEMRPEKSATRPVSSRIFVALGALCGIVALGLALLAFQNGKQRMVTSVKKQILESTVQQVKEPERIFVTSHAVLRGLIRDSLVINFLSSGGQEADREAVENTLSHFDIDKYPSIYLLLPNGLCVAATDKTSNFVGNNFGFRDYFKKSIAGESWTDMSVGVTTKLPGYYFSEPVRDSDGNIVGVAAAKLDNSVIETAAVSDALKSFNSNIMLTDSDGVIIFSQNKDFLYKTLSSLSEEKKQELIAKKKFALSNFETVNFNPVRRAIDDYSGPTSVDFVDPSDKKAKIMAIVKISDSPFYLMAEFDRNSAILASGKDAISIAAYVGILLVFLIVVGVLYLKIKSNRNKFKQQEILRTQLEKTVADRTSELRAANENLQVEIKEREKVALELVEKNKDLEEFSKIVVDREMKMMELKNRIRELEEKETG